MDRNKLIISQKRRNWQPIMESIGELIRELDESRENTQTLLNGIDPAVELYKGWTIRHFLAHLTGWDEAVTTSLRAHTTGNEPGTPAYRGVEYYNEQSVAERIALTYRQILVECDMARDHLKAAIRAVPEAKWQEPILAPWAQTLTVRQLVRVIVNHERQHANELRDLIVSLAGQAHNQSTRT